MRIGLLIGVALSVFGCEYGPEHIPHFQAQIANFESTINSIEEKYGIERSIPYYRRQAEHENLKSSVAAMQRAHAAEVGRLKAELDAQYQNLTAKYDADRERFRAEYEEQLRENQRVRKQLAAAEEELQLMLDEWFKGLDKEQQLQYRMNRELIRAGVRGQVEQTFKRETSTK